MILNPGYLIVQQTASLYAHHMRERALKRRLFDLQRVLIAPTVCVSCGSSEFRLHGMRHVCAYCRTSSARSR